MPELKHFIRKVVNAGFRLLDFMDLHRYLVRCHNSIKFPEVYDLIRAILP